jgi:hypothetical protein
MSYTPRSDRVIGAFKYLLSKSPRRSEITEAVDEFSLIPETIENYPVRGISDLFLCHCLEHSIPIPPFISEIFRSPGPPSPLSRIEIPPSIEEIRLDCVVPAFTGFCSLTELVFPPGIVLRDLFGFTECPALSQIALPPSVERVNAFSNCRALREIHFSEEGRIRELDGFANLPSLFQVTIPSSVEVIGKSGFGGCPS